MQDEQAKHKGGGSKPVEVVGGTIACFAGVCGQFFVLMLCSVPGLIVHFLLRAAMSKFHVTEK